MIFLREKEAYKACYDNHRFIPINRTSLHKQLYVIISLFSFSESQGL